MKYKAGGICGDIGGYGWTKHLKYQMKNGQDKNKI